MSNPKDFPMDIQSKKNKTHKLKTWAEYYEKIVSGEKDFEVRKNDSDFKVGDVLILIETNFGGAGMSDHDLSQVPTGKTAQRKVKYILKGGSFGIDKDYVVLGLEVPIKNPVTEKNSFCLTRDELFKIWDIGYCFADNLTKGSPYKHFESFLESLETGKDKINSDEFIKFSDYIKSKTLDTEKAGDGYDGLSDKSKFMIDYAISKYILFINKGQC